MESRATLRVGPELAQFVENRALAGLPIDADAFWESLNQLIETFTDKNRQLITKRVELQSAIDDWHDEHPGPVTDAQKYFAMLQDIDYIALDHGPVEVTTERVDPELASIAGPQLVVPVTNARYVVNAANARWGSLYDAFYGTDALGSPPPNGPYDEERGALVVDRVRQLLDESFPLEAGSHTDVTRYRVHDGGLWADTPLGTVSLVEPASFAGYTGNAQRPDAVVLTKHGLRIVLKVDDQGRVGSGDLASVDDILIESAVTAIVDFEDSVATVDAADKAHAYSNWLGLMDRTLTAEVDKDGGTFTRSLAEPMSYTSPTGDTEVLPAQATLLVRNVGHLTTTPAVLDRDGNAVFEGLLDAMFTVLCAAHDVIGERRNSPAGSIYVVKPKMHGPEEVEFACDVFSFIEDALGLEPNTVKIGIMDEERRTTLNLRECLRMASERVVFVNTGFLDRTGDEIHTSMHAGPFVPKGEMRSQRWIQAYEDWNVDVALSSGLLGRGQIGKGMWAQPEAMAAMLAAKQAHPRAGASCAWVPSPTAASLHAVHYLQVDVRAVQQRLMAGGRRATIDDLLTVPVVDDPGWTKDLIQSELDNNVQGILGYVVRWIDQGIGCSTVPDVHGTGLMEDRATCRISSQHVANWLMHGIVTAEQIDATFERMAVVVDEQNGADSNYIPMAPGFDGHAFRAARDLVFEGAIQPNGYTEPILHRRRRNVKNTRPPTSPRRSKIPAPTHN